MLGHSLAPRWYSISFRAVAPRPVLPRSAGDRATGRRCPRNRGSRRPPAIGRDRTQRAPSHRVAVHGSPLERIRTSRPYCATTCLALPGLRLPRYLGALVLPVPQTDARLLARCRLASLVLADLYVSARRTLRTCAGITGADCSLILADLAYPVRDSHSLRGCLPGLSPPVTDTPALAMTVTARRLPERNRALVLHA